MSNSVNRVILFGFLEQDPAVIRVEGSDERIAKLVISTFDSLSPETLQGDRAECHRVVVLDERLIALVERDLRKGSKVYIEGRLQSRVWSSHFGGEICAAEVVVPRTNGIIITFAGRQGIGSNEDAMAQD